MSRDYVREFSELMLREAPRGGWYAVPIVAREVVEKLRAQDPDLLAGFLDARAVLFVGEWLSARDRRARSDVRRRDLQVERSGFGAAASKAMEGDASSLARYRLSDQVYVVNPDGLRKPLKDMLKPELLYAAEDLEVNGRESLFEAAFLRAIAKRCRGSRVGEVLPEDAIARLRRSLRGDAA